MPSFRFTFRELLGDTEGAQIARDAIEFQESQAEVGRRVDIIEAVNHVVRDESFDPDNPRDLQRVAYEFQEGAKAAGTELQIEEAVSAARLLGQKQNWDPERVMKAAVAVAPDQDAILPALKAIAGEKPEQAMPLLSEAKNLILEEKGRPAGRDLSLLDAILEVAESDTDSKRPF
jgi:hypothetical protein